MRRSQYLGIKSNLKDSIKNLSWRYSDRSDQNRNRRKDRKLFIDTKITLRNSRTSQKSHLIKIRKDGLIGQSKNLSKTSNKWQKWTLLKLQRYSQWKRNFD